MDKSIIINLRKKLFKNENTPYLLLLFLICFIFLWKFVFSTQLIKVDDYGYWVGMYKYMKHTIFLEKAYYYWIPNFAYGFPFIAWPEMPILAVSTLTTLLIPSPYIAFNITLFIQYFLALVAMYFLLKDFKIDKKFCLIGAVFFVFSGSAEHFHQAQIMGLIYMPLAFLFFRRAIKKTNFRNIFLCGLFLALMVFSGSLVYLIFTSMFIFMYLVYKLILGKNKISKISTFALIFIIFFFLAAPKLIPSLEYVKITNRAQPVSYQEYSQKGVFDNFGQNFAKHFLFSNKVIPRLGILPLILLFLSPLLLFNKKEYLFLYLVIIFILLFLFTPLNLFFYKFVPLIGKTRHIDRFFILASFAMSILIARTAQILYKSYKGKHRQLIYIGVFVLIILNFIFPYWAVGVVGGIDNEKSYRVYDYVSEIIEPGDRVALYKISDPWGYGSAFVYNPGLKNIKTFEGQMAGIWIPHDILFYRIALQNNFPRYMGLVSSKYLLSKENLSLNLIEQFEECEECYSFLSNQLNLYENPDYLPNAYLADKAVLYLGSENGYNQIFFHFFNNDILDPNYVSLLYTPETSSIGYFDNFDAVIIEGGFQLGGKTNSLLSAYESSGGKIFWLTDQESLNSLTAYLEEQKSNSDDLVKLDANYKKNNKFYIRNKGLNGFAIFSERFFLFPKTWKTSNGEIIYRSNYIQSAAYLTEENEEINLTYTPYMFYPCLFLSLLTLILSILYINKKKLKSMIKT